MGWPYARSAAGLVLTGALTAAGCGSPEPPPGSDPDALTYAARIRPMLEKPCLGCHGRWLPQAGLSMDTREGLIKGGRSGPAIAPGEPEKGWLIHAVTVSEGKYRMPPQGERLTDEQVALIRRWIAAGAP